MRVCLAMQKLEAQGELHIKKVQKKRERKEKRIRLVVAISVMACKEIQFSFHLQHVR